MMPAVASLTTRSADGTEVRARADGTGPVILVLHAARDDGSAWGRVAARLADRFRVVRLHRRQHRLDLDAIQPCSIASEVEDVFAVICAVGAPVVVVGHSSGGVVALEAMVASPSTFVGAVLYEPPAFVKSPVGGQALLRARDAHAAGSPAEALTIFLRDVAGVRPTLARLVGTISAAVPRRRAYISHQLDDCLAIDELGPRLSAYAGLDIPTVLLGGRRSPAHFRQRMAALAEVMPRAETVVLRRQGHYANILAPGRVAQVVASHAGRCFSAS
jgi:pimeloyl-ACP methyl ester carboxylesterase